MPGRTVANPGGDRYAPIAKDRAEVWSPACHSPPACAVPEKRAIAERLGRDGATDLVAGLLRRDETVRLQDLSGRR
ncbi:hypothetical protein [Actinomadura sp. DC4]|uniref:hypothetical protein n=1 Tax=Actinomadura sp. DC4 TaxID=3055069 RepID=UPI0025B21A27|nr:hypothetical protein [Actinomadura sp. DC4]MDN3355358.1 hypothetical protein [Actinomadura sp. DC4]